MEKKRYTAPEMKEKECMIISIICGSDGGAGGHNQGGGDGGDPLDDPTDMFHY